MKRQISFFIFLFAGSVLSFAQSAEKTALNAYLISRMVEKYHVQPRPLNDEMSAAIYSHLLESLDDQRIFFTQEDITKLSAFRLEIDDEIKNRQSTFLREFTSIYKTRLQQADTIVDNICKTPFNFSIKEKYTVAEDTSYPVGIAGMHTKLYKLLKHAVLTAILNRDTISLETKLPSKRFIDSLEPRLRKTADRSLKRFIKRLLQSPQGIEYIVGTMYCQAEASCYDPHTAYFPPDVKSAFESQLGNKPLEFGFSLDENEDGNIEINHLAPGGPAFKSGMLSEGDKMISLQWENKDPIDVAGASVEEVGHMLRAFGGNKMIITVRKADGTTRQVTLHKEKVAVEDDEEDKVKGFLLKGKYTVGYVSLPAFYQDWEDSRGLNGCANDVAREIIKLKKENIDGLILDLRYNGGGSMLEAVELTGIFIDAGPLAQIKTKEAKTITLKDVNRGTIYDGPLLVLVNGSSASASEMVAGSLQDYHRALIVGSATYGKATAQVVLPMDTTINLSTYNGKAVASDYIKLTVSKLYRINGSTAQINSVVPDIVLPDPSDALSEREADEKFALRVAPIEPNKYYQPLAPIPVTAAKETAKKEIDSSSYFRATMEYIQAMKNADRKKDVPLSLNEAWQEMKQKNTKPDPPELTDYPDSSPGYTVLNHIYEQRRMQTNPDLQETNEEWKNNLLNDPYVKVAYNVMNSMIK
ncbi:MAG: hypothetical protein C5B59_06200 [Bacteroidetes bacterium]|nr:MAG: hypothetical protein C5B59_06200 [Bacteroidota bacterium]